MVRYFLTDFRGNPIYSFAQRLRRNNNNLLLHARLLSVALDRANSNNTTNNNNGTSFATTTLVCMIRNQAWDDVLKRIERHPTEVLAQDPITGNTVLHVACQLQPPAAVVRALMITTAARVANLQGATALHTAVSHRCSADVLRVLLEQDEVCANDDDDDDELQEEQQRHTDGLHTSKTADLSRMGRAPIHYACMSFRGLDMEAFRLLVDATLREGNVWVRRWDGELRNAESELDGASLGMSNGILLEGDDEDQDDEEDGDHDDTTARPRSFHCEFGTEVGDSKNLFLPMIDDLTCEESTRDTPVLVNVMGLKDATGQTPLSLLFRRYRERVRCVINTVDRLRDTSSDDNPDRAALVAAIRVHADLGELWEKARFIIARLTEERIQRERLESSDHQDLRETKLVPDRKTDDATSRRATYFGTAKSSAFYDPTADPPSPGATAWAIEAHQDADLCEEEMILPLASVLNTDHMVGTVEPKLKNRKFRIVHASVGLTGYGCPPELIRLAISVHPHQVMEMDDEGNLPIHIAATAASYLATAHGAVSCPDYSSMAAAAAVGNDDHSVLSDAAMSFFSSASVSQTANPFDKVIKILLQHYPESARIPHGQTGRLPLVMAIESGRRTWADGVETLLHAYPPALHHKKVVEPHVFPDVLARVANTSKFSFELAATGEKKKKKSTNRVLRHKTCSRSTLFELIRSKPDWVTRGYVHGEN